MRNRAKRFQSLISAVTLAVLVIAGMGNLSAMAQKKAAPKTTSKPSTTKTTTAKTAPVVVPNRNPTAPNSLVAPPAVNLPPIPELVIPDLSGQR